MGQFFLGNQLITYCIVSVTMGAPKQKWTAEEEAALKAGVLKHGAGKWRTILKDPEYNGVLYLRSNVDLKVLHFFVVRGFGFTYLCYFEYARIVTCS